MAIVKPSSLYTTILSRDVSPHAASIRAHGVAHAGTAGAMSDLAKLPSFFSCEVFSLGVTLRELILVWNTVSILQTKRGSRSSIKGCLIEKRDASRR